MAKSAYRKNQLDSALAKATKKKKPAPTRAAVKKGAVRKTAAGKPAPAKPRKRVAKVRAPEPKVDPKIVRARPFWKRWTGWLIKRALVLVIVISLIPVILTGLYWPSFVHPISTLMATHWVSGKNVRRDWVAFDDIAPSVWQSVMMSEDGQFCSHGGVDWNQINIVVEDALEGDRIRGASTISMQTVKNLYLWNSRSYLRKALEVPYAMMIDAVWSKRRVMEIYLNIAEWGPGIYGIGAASRHHFKRPASKLSRRQSALLAVTLPNPILRNPRKPTRRMKLLARLVERRAKASGAYIGCLK